jgi:putative peptidoglycan lipid II flippase
MALMACAAASNPYIDFIMVGHLEPGGATLVEYSGRLRGLPFMALNGVLIVLFGDWSRLYGEELSRAKVKQGAWNIALCGVVLSGALVLSRHYWVPLIFHTDQFDSNHLITVNQLMFWYLVGVPFMIAGNVFSRGFLVWQRFNLLCYFSFLSVVINVVLNVVFIKIFGIPGVAMSTTGLDIVMLCTLIYVGKQIGH